MCTKLYKMSLVMRNLAFGICGNKSADQLRSNCAADQRLCFRYMDSTIPLLPKSEISSSSHLLWLYSPVCIGPSQKPRRPVFSQRGSNDILHQTCIVISISLTNEPRCEKTGLWGFRPGPTQTRLYNHTRWLEACNFVSRK